MKNKILFGLATLALIGCSETTESETTTDSSNETSKKEYSISCDFKGVDITKAYLSQYVKGSWENADSADVVDGKFTFTGRLDHPEIWYLKFKDRKDYIPVFVENCQINVAGSSLNKDSVDVSGSAMHDNLKEVNEGIEKFYKQMDELSTAYYAAEEAGDTAKLSQIEKDYDKIALEESDFVKSVISKNNSNVLGPFLTLTHLLSNLSVSEIDSTLKEFSEDILGSKYVVAIQERYDKLKSTDIGVSAPLFTQNDADGNPVSLESFKGSYVLLDFWASWCGPCRKENPNVVAAYGKYHSAGFEILGISLDDNQANWLSAIEKDGLTWTHVSDLNGWGNEVAQLYGVNSIPHSILLDKDGVIIAKNLRGEELHSKLEEVLNSEM